MPQIHAKSPAPSPTGGVLHHTNLECLSDRDYRETTSDCSPVYPRSPLHRAEQHSDPSTGESGRCDLPGHVPAQDTHNSGLLRHPSSQRASPYSMVQFDLAHGWSGAGSNTRYGDINRAPGEESSHRSRIRPDRMFLLRICRSFLRETSQEKFTTLSDNP